MTSETTITGVVPARDKSLLILPPILALALVPIGLLEKAIAASLSTQIFVVLLIILAVIDFLTMRVPNLLVFPSIVFALIATALVNSDLLVDAGLGGLALLAAMFVIAFLGRGAMGMGDVKVAAFIGCVVGLRAGAISLLFGFAIGGTIALLVLVLRLRDRKDSLPLTPFLAVGTILNILLFGSMLTRGQP